MFILEGVDDKVGLVSDRDLSELIFGDIDLQLDRIGAGDREDVRASGDELPLLDPSGCHDSLDGSQQIGVIDLLLDSRKLRSGLRRAGTTGGDILRARAVAKFSQSGLCAGQLALQ